MDVVIGVLLLVFASSPSPILTCGVDEPYFDVINYGATGDGCTDDSQAWDAACSSSLQSATLYVPPETIFLVHPLIFHGPCNTPIINFLILGTMIAPESPSLWDERDASQWLAFTNIDGLNIDGYGYGVVDGKGESWWDQSCKYHPLLENCTSLAPTAWKILGCNDSSIRNVKFINSAQTHMLVKGCNDFIIENVIIESPENSPNTDGIHIQSSHHLLIINSTIACGDDCISIGDYISDMKISNIQCGPGHGISIGSLGRGGNYVQVENIQISKAIFNGTTNGARIKTWQVGRGYVRRVTFEKLVLHNVNNPIIIDQNYCNIRGACQEQESGVEISNIVYREIQGTSASRIAINLNCSNWVPCYGIWMESIELTAAIVGMQVTANCSNASGREQDTLPGPCLRQF
ncbi:polygalacturonase ADPG1-like isoform X2 [Salvia splendens]|uniref:polygalacturonase ADPG1-like isoform X2 n=1 Tax=Salvia splendens TaxID=180675 RepID=UPI001105143E|nr:polygalacturonase ADPG1-like isoform X2 [Salvia splendens]